MPAGRETTETGSPGATARKLARQGRVDKPVELLRSGDNHVFRAKNAILRLSPLTTDPSGQMALAARLEEQGVPVQRGLADLGVVDGMRASLWELIDAGPDAAIDYEALGRAVARLHSLPPDTITCLISLPRYADAQWLQLDANLERAAETGLLDDTALGALRRACDELHGWAEAAARGPQVVCHGDLHPHNVLVRNGEPVLIDWDQVCLGPPAWDHAALMTWAERWGGDDASYEAYARGYGADYRDDPAGRLLARVRLLAPTVNMVIRGASDPACAAEAARRLRYWRGDAAAPQWIPQ